MRQTLTSILIVLFILCANLLFGQDSIQFPNNFEFHKEKSQELNHINLFRESIAELNIAIDIAKRNNNDEQLIDATVSLGELMRRTQQYPEGMEILRGLSDSYKHPRHHVRKLGRMAAIYAEYGREFEKLDKKLNAKDSIKLYLNEALKIAVEKNFSLEEASLRNELGLFILRHQNLENAISELMQMGFNLLEK
jgi:hypothetical protein